MVLFPSNVTIVNSVSVHFCQDVASVCSVWDSAEEPTGSQEDHGQIPHYHITFWHQESTLKCWNYRFFAKSFFTGQGMAIGKCPKNKLLKGYIELELQLREFDRCRKLYEKYLEFSPENCTTWIKFAELETILGDTDRARAIFELAIGQPRLDMPEVSEIINCYIISE